MGRLLFADGLQEDGADLPSTGDKDQGEIDPQTEHRELKDPRIALPTLLWISFVSPHPRETLSAATAPSPKNRLSPHPTTVIGKITPVAALPRSPTPLPTNI